MPRPRRGKKQFSVWADKILLGELKKVWEARGWDNTFATEKIFSEWLAAQKETAVVISKSAAEIPAKKEDYLQLLTNMAAQIEKLKTEIEADALTRKGL